MDKRFRVYYLVNFNHHWWDSNLDIGDIVYNENIRELQRRVPSLKITPNNQEYNIELLKRFGVENVGELHQKKVSCLKEEETLLRNTMSNLKYIRWTKVG